MYQEKCRLYLINCGAVIQLWASSEADCEYPLDLNQESISVTYIGTTCNIQHRRIHHPVRKVTHSTTQNSGVAGRGGARGGDDGLRNYECFPSSHLPHAKCSPWKGNPQPHAKCPSWKGNPQPHAKCSLTERDSLPINFMLE